MQGMEESRIDSDVGLVSEDCYYKSSQGVERTAQLGKEG